MFGKPLVADMISRSAENPADRRNFLRAAGLAGLGAVGAVTAMTVGAQDALAADAPISDGAILNFALNLEYLEAEYYLRATTGQGLPDSLTTGTKALGGVTGGSQVPFKAGSTVAKYAREIAADELAHVKFLRGALGSAAVARPKINFTDAFNAAATAAGVIKAGDSFDPFKDETSFLLGAFIFEDLGVTAYKGGAPLISNKDYLGAAAGILAVEAYHAGLVRRSLYNLGVDVAVITNKISDARDSLDGRSDDDQGVLAGNPRAYRANLVPADKDAIAYSRSPQQVHNIAYLTASSGVTKGGFFPDGTNNDDARLTTT
ncbi:ferritin-like domain-containing protein [Quadrisphaera setariae]|uniref:Ferritin-like domain-containing protein n=1 Tax=Quadrisphaera setariae TaxID=2593304 RepID=A0A5C8ZLB3_9ACTN|nr:ferritin-like domain-containing protein [Quadrisphaera setariae]TXR57961.1 ferritin-like domain-containing protein [Quadrisphaera setariae]